MDTNRFDVWFDQEFPNWGVNAVARETERSIAKRAWEAALVVQQTPKPIDGNARLAGFGSPATVTPPKRPILPEPEPLDGLMIKHWNIWDISKSRFASIGLDKQAAHYWAQRYNAKAKSNIYLAVPMLNDR